MKTANVLLLAEARDLARSGRGAAIRVGAGLSQVELGAACGVSGSAVSLWESGERRPRGKAAVRYANLLKLLAENNRSHEMREAGFPAPEPLADANVDGNGTAA